MDFIYPQLLITCGQSFALDMDNSYPQYVILCNTLKNIMEINLI